jgi:hypothetical protein
MLAGVACEVAVVSVDHRETRPHVAAEVEGRDAGSQREGRERVPEIVDPPRRVDPGGKLGALPRAGAEVVQVEVAAARRGEEKWRLETRREAVERLERDRLQRDGAQAGLGLGALQATVGEGMADVDDADLTVDVTALERDPLPGPKAGRRREDDHRPEDGTEPGGDGLDLGPGLEGPHLLPPPLRVLDADGGRVDVDDPPGDGPAEYLPECLRRLEAMAPGHCHPPGRQLVRAETADAAVPKCGYGLREQPAQLRQRHRVDVVLGQVLLDELGEGDLRQRVAPMQIVEGAVQRLLRLVLCRESTSLQTLRAATVEPVAIRPQRLAVSPLGLESEHLSTLSIEKRLPFELPSESEHDAASRGGR